MAETHDPTFKWKIYGFSSLLVKGTMPVYSGCFPCNCSGYSWYLQLNPMLKQSGASIPYIALSLYLSPSNFKKGYIISAVFKISMFNHSNGAYFGCQARYRFKFRKTNSGLVWLIPLEELLKSSDFLVDDCCVFGVRMIKADVSSPEKAPVVVPEKSITTVRNLFLQKK
jgi:hypothetical protein